MNLFCIEVLGIPDIVVVGKDDDAFCFGCCGSGVVGGGSDR